MSKVRENIVGRAGKCIVLCFCLMCMATRCNDEPPHVRTVYLINGSDETIFYYITDRTDVLTPASVFLYGDKVPSLKPGESCPYVIRDREGSKHPNQYYQFIVFRKSTLDNNSRKDIIEKGIYDARYILNFEELEQIGFEIVFTGE